MRSYLAGAVAGAVLAATAVSGVLAATSAGASSVPACAGSQLQVTSNGPQGGMGHGNVVFRFENTSDHTCALTGYPGVDALGKHGKLIKHAKRTLNGYTGGAKKVRTIVVRPGHFASADLEWMNFNPRTTGPCRGSRSLLVTPANTSDSTRFPLRISTCVLRIHPTVAGKSGNSRAEVQPSVEVASKCKGALIYVSHSRTQGAAGHGFVTLRFRNISQSTCTLRGFPGLDALGKKGHVLKHAKRSLHGMAGAHKVRTITLKPNRVASAAVEWLNFNGGTGGSCKFSHKIAVTPPNTSHTVRFGVHVSVCGLKVHPVVKGSTGQP